jgi:hypothetical protein
MGRSIEFVDSALSTVSAFMFIALDGSAEPMFTVCSAVFKLFNKLFLLTNTHLHLTQITLCGVYLIFKGNHTDSFVSIIQEKVRESWHPEAPT